MKVPPHEKNLIMVKYRTGCYTIRDLAIHHGYSTRTIHKMVLGMPKDLERYANTVRELNNLPKGFKEIIMESVAFKQEKNSYYPY